MIIERMKRTTEAQTQKMLFYGFAIMIFLLPLPQIVYHREVRAIAMQATVIMFAAIYFGFILAIEGVNKRFNFKTHGLVLKCMVGLTIIGIINVLFSEYKMISLYGTRLRTEGLLTLVSYYVIFLGASVLHDIKYRRRILYLCVILGCIVSVLGVLQFTNLITVSIYPGMAEMPMRNPNFFGAFAVLFTGVCIGGYFIYSGESRVGCLCHVRTRLLWFIFVLFGYVACISSSSTLVYVGLIMMLLLYLFLECASKRKKFLPFLWLVVGLVAMIVLFNLVKQGAVLNEITSVGKQIKEEGSVFGDSVGTKRMLIWKRTVALLPDFWLFGCGIELLINHCFDHMNGGALHAFDRAHNEYLNLWVTEGIVALVIYLVFLFALFLPGIAMFMKNKKTGEVRHIGDEVSKIALFAFFGYIAQAFFNNSVVQVAPYFWMICGLLYSRKRNVNEETMDR